MKDDSELACILAPLADGSLLLPNVAVAEVLRSQRVRAADNLPPWCVGRITWRGVTLPLLSFEGLNGSDGPGPRTSANDGVLVINRTRDLKEFGYYGILTRGTPRLLRLTEDDIEAVEETDQEITRSRPAELGRVQVGEDTAIIPRLTFLENQILENRLYVTAAKS